MTAESEVHERYRLAYGEALQALQQQRESLEALRTRGGSLIAATAISTSFLGGLAVDRAGLTYGSWVALAMFTLVILLTLAVILPVWLWRFEISGKEMIAWVEVDDPPAPGRMWRNLALYHEDSYDRNAPQLELLQGAFALAGILLLAEIAAWVAVIGGRA